MGRSKADNEAQARELGHAALEELHAVLRRRLDRNVPVNILVVRPATTDEIEFCRWGDEALAREGMARRI